MDRHLVVGLGNPGPRYQSNRHNVGFGVLDRIALRTRIDVGRSKFKAKFGTGTVAGKSVVLLKPTTYMNLSGQSVSPARSFFEVETEELLVIHDELDLPFGTIRLKTGGGHAGHNGLRSIIAELGESGFCRLRIGIGRPKYGTASDYVLADFGPDEQEHLPEVLDRAADAVDRVLRDGVSRAMNEVNKPEKPEGETNRG